ncbi:uncharacterized protein UTRI_06118_B [Ustilago trichophora]|uniref:Uncharacterized protein n=1 Tax=Ustilago trichophora TaxID=86804 RepID=A0A5C3EIF1_9BASI|nr:uncharacterized protein UTRI_06118_B [Ustilago trichophora]
MNTTTRAISLHERYAVARRAINSASIVSAAALLTLDGTTTTTTTSGDDTAFNALRSYIEERIQLALATYPLLAHCLQQSRSKAPRWRPISPPPTAKDVLQVGAPLTLDSSDDDNSQLLSRALLSQLNSLPQTTDYESTVLWRVQLHPIHQSTPIAAHPQRALVILSTDHVINDGRGTLNLFQFLLLQQAPPSSFLGLSPQSNIPPCSDEVFDFSPSARYMLGVVWQELILPKLPLPKPIKRKLRGSESWPCPHPSHKKRLGFKSDLSHIQPNQAAPALDILFVSAPNLITNLKKLAKANVDPRSASPKAATLHAIIHTLGLVAVYSAIAHSHKDHLPSAVLEDFKLVLGSVTPISLREETSNAVSKKSDFFAVESSPPAVKLPFTSGNLVSSYADNFSLSGRETFWKCTNKFASDLASDKGRKLAKMHMGMLGYIPDFDISNKAIDVEKAKEGGGYMNGWEKFFGEKQTSKTPFDAAFTVSNLGFLDLSKLGIPCSTIPKNNADNADTAKVEQQLLGQSPTATATVPQAHWKVTKTTWAQSHTPQGEAFGVDVVGFSSSSSSSSSSSDEDKKQNLSVAISSRPAAFADPNLHKRFVAYFRTLILAFAADPNTMLAAKRGGEKPSHDFTDRKEEKNVLDLTAGDPSFASLAKFLALSNTQLA